MDMMETIELEDLKAQARQVLEELMEAARLKPGQILVVGCSSSEIDSFKIGSHSSAEIGMAVYTALYQELKPKGIYLAAQCCEHLNRALILEAEAAQAYGYEPVNVVPQLKAGGSFATAAYATLEHPVAVEHIKAHAGQLLVQLPGRIAAVVGKKEIFLVLIMQPLNELRHPRQNAVAVVDDAVHIADEAFFLVKIDGSLHVVPPALLVNIPSSFTVSCKESDFHQETVNFSA